MAGDKKTVVKPFRMTEKEAEKLRLDAEQRGIKESEYIRLLLSQKPNDYPEIRIMLRELINEVNAIGNNINQITRNHNSKLYREEDRQLLSAYMKKLKYPIGNGGCSEELYAIRPIIEQNVKPSRLKKEILDLFDQHKGTMPGEPAPTPPLKDANGKEYTFAQFRGKVIVIDIWATWCSSCLAKMPDFIALSEKYKGNEEIIFLTVSIDRKEVRDSWLAAIEKRKMGNLLNLTPECSEESQFESDYHISGIPRYMVIDKEGNIVTAYAPPAGEGLDEIIMNTINK